jgi:DNA (cytosine-5)-methyltransferase 1
MGWQAAGFSEIEKFPSEVLAHHYPTVTNFGDMTKYKEWNLNDPIGLLVGGTPCQSFSVAGLRKGLDDPRGNLALTYLGILDQFRPKWCVWENVPGVLSSGGGRDFGAFLGALGQLGYGFAYRVLDAQNFGVAQRRRRVFVVGCLGDWRPAAEVLFEPESLSGNIKQSRETGQEVARRAAPCLASGKPTVGTLMANAGTKLWLGNQEAFSGDYRVLSPIGFESSRRDGVRLYGDQTNTLQAFAGTGGGNGPCVAIQGNLIGRDKGGPNGVGVSEGETMYTLTKADVHGVQTEMAVRRLTPVECERLQGFPDNYTNIKDKCPDGPRYKAMGNSMAVPVMRWIGERINKVNNLL